MNPFKDEKVATFFNSGDWFNVLHNVSAIIFGAFFNVFASVKHIGVAKSPWVLFFGISIFIESKILIHKSRAFI